MAKTKTEVRGSSTGEGGTTNLFLIFLNPSSRYTNTAEIIKHTARTNRLADREDLAFFVLFFPPIGSDGALLIGAAENHTAFGEDFLSSFRSRKREKKVIIPTAGSLTVLNTSALKP